MSAREYTCKFHRTSFVRVQCVCEWVCVHAMCAIHFQFHLLLALDSCAIHSLRFKTKHRHTLTRIHRDLRAPSVYSTSHSCSLRGWARNIDWHLSHSLFRSASVFLSFLFRFRQNKIKSSSFTFHRWEGRPFARHKYGILHKSNDTQMPNNNEWCGLDGRENLPALRNATKCNWPIHRAFV